MITGFHIFVDRNGTKFNTHDGEINKAGEVAIKRIALAVGSDSQYPLMTETPFRNASRWVLCRSQEAALHTKGI